MKKILFILLVLFAMPVFADYPPCGEGPWPMDGSYCSIGGNVMAEVAYTMPTVRIGSKVLVKPFVCTISSNYQSHVKGFALKYTLYVSNAALLQPTDLTFSQTGYTEKGKGYMFKTSGGSVDDIYNEAILVILNNGCSPYDPACHPGNKNTEMTVSCRTLT